MSLDEAQSFIADMAQVEALVPGGWIQLAIADHATGRMLGDAGVYVNENQEFAEIGFTLCKQAQGFGHATRAVKSLLALLFQATAVERIRAITDARNTESIAVLARAGFHKTREQHSIFKGEACNEFVYEISRADA